MADKEKKEVYNPFVSQEDDQDLRFLFGGDNPTKSKESGEEVTKTSDTKTLADIVDKLPDDLKGPIAKGFKSLIEKVEALEKGGQKSNTDEVVGKLTTALETIVSSKKKESGSEEDEQDRETLKYVNDMFKKLGVDDDTQLTHLARFIDRVAERRARKTIEPYANHYVQKTAREERALIESKYSIKEGYPSLSSCSKEINAYLDDHPTVSLEDAYRMTNFDRIMEIRSSKGKEKEKEKGKEGGEDYREFLRKIEFSEGTPSSSNENLGKKGITTLEEAFDEALKDLNVASNK